MVKLFYVNSFPRSGNTWLRMMLIDLLSPHVFDQNPIFSQTSSGCWKAEHPRINAEECRRDICIVKSHGKYETCIKDIPIIYLIRDGRDSMYSYYHFNLDHRGYEESWDSYFRRVVVDRQLSGFREEYLDAWMGTWSENCLSYMGKSNVLPLFYEKLRSETLLSLITLFNFLGIDCVPVDQMKATIGKFEEQLSQKKKNHERPRGATGGWRDVYTPEQRMLFWHRHGSCLELLGYEKQ